MSKTLAEIFFDAIKADTDLMQHIESRITSTAFEIPSGQNDDNTPVPNIIVIDDGFQNNASNKELRMPTKVHDFSAKAARSASGEWDWDLKNNVDYMTGVMESVGFKTIDGEWWHFENPGTTGLETELNYDALTYIPISQYNAQTPAAPEEGEAQ